MRCFRVIIQWRVRVLVTKVINLLLVHFHNFGLVCFSLFLLLHLLLDSLNTHDAHEIVGRVAQLGAREIDAAEIINCLVCFVKVNNLSFGQQHEPIHHFVYVRVWLMNGLYDRTPSSREVLQSFHNRGCCERVKTGGRLVQENKVWVSD